ncbi:MAG: hypothetical protein RL238_3394 [Actinomycetota bacterium]
MLHRSALVFAVALTTLAACGGGGDSSADTTSSGAEVTTGDTAAETTAATAAETTVPATDAPGDATAECMNGTWQADAAEHQRRIDSMGIPLPMTVGPESVSGVIIDNGSFVADSSIVIIGTIAELTLTSSSSSHIEGTFTLDGDVVHADVTVNDIVAGAFVATLPDGTEVSMPGAGVEPPSPAPSFEGSTVVCDATTLSFDVIGSEFGSITYTRIG